MNLRASTLRQTAFDLSERARILCPLVVLCFCLLLLAGCTNRPHAPALSDEPVYQNAEEGFRFLVPEGWLQYARRNYPPGRADKEHLLVAYRRSDPTKPAALEVSRVDFPRTTDLASYFTGGSDGAKLWQSEGPPENVEVDGVPGTRLAYSAMVNKEPTTKEITAFWRDDRLYFFTGIFLTSDTKVREEIHRAVASTLWKH